MPHKKIIAFIFILLAVITLFSVLVYKGEKKDCKVECEGKEMGCSTGCSYLNLIGWMAKYRTYSAIWLIFFISVLWLIMYRHN